MAETQDASGLKDMEEIPSHMKCSNIAKEPKMKLCLFCRQYCEVHDPIHPASDARRVLHQIHRGCDEWLRQRLSQERFESLCSTLSFRWVPSNSELETHCKTVALHYLDRLPQLLGGADPGAEAGLQLLAKHLRLPRELQEIIFTPDYDLPVVRPYILTDILRSVEETMVTHGPPAEPLRASFAAFWGIRYVTDFNYDHDAVIQQSANILVASDAVACRAVRVTTGEATLDPQPGMWYRYVQVGEDTVLRPTFKVGEAQSLLHAITQKCCRHAAGRHRGRTVSTA